MARYSELVQQLYREGLAGRTSDLPLTAEGLEREAAGKLPPEVYGYVAGGAGSGATIRANLRAFTSWEIVPRQLQGVAERDLSIELFGSRLPTPLLLAPIGALGAVMPQGELEVARAAAELGVPMTLSTLSGETMEDVAAELHQASGVGWFQLYWPTDRDVAQSLVHRAERAGFSALVLTVDNWTLAWRPQELMHGYLPFHRGHGLANYRSDPVFRSRLGAGQDATTEAVVDLWSQIYSNPHLNWSDLAWLRAETTLPILVKGICHPDDARRAVEAGVDGLIVSNHGGRQVDGARPALDCLPQVLTASGSLPVLFDSGIRSGADAVKALALGARAVLVGRPYVYGLALAGRRGVEHVLRCLL
ncbi:MAG TPA: alpha-hydroxy-acid oxidizing protein, partial [Candidatus Dormibacteraeota bacterium]